MNKKEKQHPTEYPLIKQEFDHLQLLEDNRKCLVCEKDLKSGESSICKKCGSVVIPIESLSHV